MERCHSCDNVPVESPAWSDGLGALPLPPLWALS